MGGAAAESNPSSTFGGGILRGVARANTSLTDLAGRESLQSSPTFLLIFLHSQSSLALVARRACLDIRLDRRKRDLLVSAFLHQAIADVCRHISCYDIYISFAFS